MFHRTLAPAAALLALACIGQESASAQAAGALDMSREERLRRNFNEIDSNFDGLLTADEFAETRLKNFNRVDANGDGMIQEGEMMGYRGPGARKYLTRRQFELRRLAFYKMDKDLDRRINTEEYLFKAKQSFNSLDADRDGQITIDEFMREPVTRRGRTRRN